jgi:hypothetical protein
MALALVDMRKRKKRDFRVSPTPEFAWVPDFVSKIEKQFGFTSPPIYIRKGRHVSGTTFNSSLVGPTHIVVVLRPDSTAKRRKTTEWVLVHELAHVASTNRNVSGHIIWYKMEGHNDIFYDWFWKIAKFAKIDLAVALDEESHYKVRSSIKMAKVHGIPGAYARDREHKAALRTRRLIRSAYKNA